MAAQGAAPEAEALLKGEVKNYQAIEAAAPSTSEGLPSPKKKMGGWQAEEGDGDAMNYDAYTLTTWRCFWTRGGTIWSNNTLWKMWGLLLVLTFSVTLAVLAIVDDPGALRVSKFLRISTFLNVFVGLLLGFFLSSSVTRWYNCANGFLELFDAVRNLQMQFYALGVPEDRIALALRYGVLSAWLLNMELHAEVLKDKEKEAYLDGMWDYLVSRSSQVAIEEDSDKPEMIFMLHQERTLLRSVDDPSGLMWVWVASLVGRMSQDGQIPGMPTPTYGRIMNLCQNAHGGIRTVRASISVQTPFVYAHMLASLVHINNILNAISFGMTLGSAIGTLMAHYKMKTIDLQTGDPQGRVYPERTTHGEMSRDMQDVVVSFFYSCFGPFLYQALLEVAICIASPFGAKEGQIPTDRLLKMLQQDLLDGRLMARNTPHWEQPRFQQPK